jgi:putative FmdB family regulatory protein
MTGFSRVPVRALFPITPFKMPIYAYRCETCGFQQDVLQKMSDPRLVTCPSCGSATFQKQVTAAGFQLKGSGWYVTDFRNPAAKEGAKSAKPEGSGSGDAKGDAPPTETKGDSPAAPPAPAAASEPKPPATPAKAAPPAGGTA